GFGFRRRGVEGVGDLRFRHEPGAERRLHRRRRPARHGHATGRWPLGGGREPPAADGRGRVPGRRALGVYAAALRAGGPRRRGGGIDRARREMARRRETGDDAGPRVPPARPRVGGAKPAPEAVRALLAQQRADGGWSQLPELESDAYASGQVLYAL